MPRKKKADKQLACLTIQSANLTEPSQEGFRVIKQGQSKVMVFINYPDVSCINV